MTIRLAVETGEVCEVIDRLNLPVALSCTDPDMATPTTNKGCEEWYAKGKVPFLTEFTDLGTGEKGNRLKDEKGNEIAPSDLPVIYATTMLKLR